MAKKRGGDRKLGLEQEVPVKVLGNGKVREAMLIRDLIDPMNDVVIYPEPTATDSQILGADQAKSA